MQTVLIAILLLVLAMLALGVGLAFGRSPLKPSCGGEACLTACAGCDRHNRSETS
jgi:hypothetical protein